MRKRGKAYPITKMRKMNAVGMDVFKGKSMVAVLRSLGARTLLPQEFLYDEVDLNLMAHAIIVPRENARVAIIYHKSVAVARHRYGISISVLNRLYIKQEWGNSIHNVNTNKVNAMKVTKYDLYMKRDGNTKLFITTAA